MIKDKFLNWLAVFICMIVSASMLFHSLPYWWIGGVIAFLLIGFYLNDGDEYEQQLNELPEDWEDYKATYEPPDEYNLQWDEYDEDGNHMWSNHGLSANKKFYLKHLHGFKDWQAETKKVSFCHKCGNEVYEICMCKPVIKDNTD